MKNDLIRNAPIRVNGTAAADNHSKPVCRHELYEYVLNSETWTTRALETEVSQE